MPPRRPLRTKEEIDKVPPEKSVTLELQPEGGIDLEGENPFEEENPQHSQQQDKKKQAKAATEEPPQEDDTADLKRQLEEMRLAKDASDRRIQDEIRGRQEAERLVKEREQETRQVKTRAEDAEYDAILNAIGAAESEAEGAQRDIALASEASNAQGVAEASRRLARAESRLIQLQDGKDAIEREKTTQAAKAKEDAQRPPAPKEQQTVDQFIDQMPNLLGTQRDWLKQHPEVISDTRKNMRLQGAHVDAEDQGLRVGSAEYFEFLEARLGYKKPESRDDMSDDDERRAPVSAPPSRNATSPSTGKAANNRITLSPEQREIARLSGIDELTYAKQLQRMNALKAEGHLQ